MTRQDRDEHHQPQAIRPDRHHHSVERDDLPERRGKGADGEPEDQQSAAQQQQPARPEPVDEHPDKRRAEPGDQLRHRIGHRRLGPAPAELLDKGDEVDRIGMHQPGADRERGKGAAEQQPGRADAPPGGYRGPLAHHRNLREIAPRVTWRLRGAGLRWSRSAGISGKTRCQGDRDDRLLPTAARWL